MSPERFVGALAIAGLLLGGCVGSFVRVVPSTNDAKAWQASWVEDAKREHEKWLASHTQEALRCDPLMRSNAEVGPRPGCAR